MIKNDNKFVNKCNLKGLNLLYDYSESKYINSNTPIEIRCLLHGITFNQTPVDHIRGYKGCPICNGKDKYSENGFLLIVNNIHKCKYSYPNLTNLNSIDKIDIICDKHGLFKQLVNNHLKGQGCVKCGVNSSSKNKTYNNEIFIKKSIDIHGEKFDYSLVDYKFNKYLVKIICPTHGEFNQLPVDHLRGRGCPNCSLNNRNNKITKTKELFIEQSIIVHGELYDYSQINYINSQNKINIICPKHGIFEQLPYDHISGHGCNKCSSSISKGEIEINDFINSFKIDTITSSRSIINPQQIDIFIPSLNIAIEYNGLYWHSEEFIEDKNYHLNKTNQCIDKGIKLIHIFEDEWLYKQDIVKSRLKNMLGLTENRVYGRKCDIREVSSKESRLFLDENHLQGNTNSSIRIGLYYNDLLISLMLFNKPRLGIGVKYDGYELSRFSNKLNTIVIGGADKLLKHFIKTYNPKEIVSYADKRWGDGNLYKKLNFTLKHVNKPNYWYIVGKKRNHRFNYRKEVLKKQGFSTTNKTEHQIMLERKIYRIYDCGTITYKKTLY